MKDLTVCLLTHNRGEMLLETIDSILSQSCNDFYFVISDNSSNDESMKLVKEKYGDSTRFIYKKRDKEYSSLDHFNLCLKEITTHFFVLFHDDDLMLPDYVDNLYSSIAGSNYVAVGSNAYYLYNNRKTKKKYWKSRCDQELKAADLVNQYCERNIVPYPSYMYSKEILNDMEFLGKCGKYGDVTWLLDICNRGKLLWLSKPHMYYRIHSNQDSQNIDIDNQLLLIEYFKNIVGNNIKSVLIYESYIKYSNIVIEYKKTGLIPKNSFRYLFKHNKICFIKLLVRYVFFRSK